MTSTAVAMGGKFADAPARLRAVITDLDGTLCDTERVLVSAINRFLVEEGQAPLAHDEARTMAGFGNEGWWRQVSALRPTLAVPLDEYTRRVDAVAQTLFPTDLRAADGAPELIAAVHRMGAPFALVTNSRRAWAFPRLEIMGISDAFDAILTGDMVSEYKPHPEIYLEASRALGVDPADAFAIEDSPSGIAAARDAGLYTIAVRNSWMEDADQSHAHVIVDSLREIDVEGLLGGGERP